MLRLRFIALLSLFLLNACSPAPMEAQTTDAAYQPPGAATPSATAKSASNAYLAYEHNVVINTEYEKGKTLLQSITHNCQQNPECAILKAEQYRAGHNIGSITLRAPAVTVSEILASLEKGGEVAQMSSHAEDLSGAIVDNKQRLEQLMRYREKLEHLQSKANNDINALIQLNRELAEVQVNIEDLTGKSSYLIQRVKTELLTININQAYEYQKPSVWSPITSALDDFVDTLTTSLGVFITFIAVLLPWSLLIILFIWGVRKLWRKRTSRKAAKAA